ncbi:hypothetical protein NZK35_20100 [Stieleria sp. ICT_E10.1]|uniref:hypothetical protein n=1 Tax=Stieleria sedimenti TaxID=2976331 RepID=UPI00217FA99E|nr:hypothetical protein [Stieleria sedimenti]MCS7468962.1 hypothetical protein [Stieleria sedimenti]
MTQIVLCPKCNVRVSVSESQAGRRVRCPGCSQPFLTAPVANQVIQSVAATDHDEDWLGLKDLPSDLNFAPQKAPQASPDIEQFRVRCPKCESIKYVSISQVGSTVRCNDCHSRVKVPRPPKKLVSSSSPTPTSHLASDPFPDSFPGSETHPFERRTENAGLVIESVMKSAEVDVEAEDQKLSREENAMSSWTKSILSVFIDPGVVIHLVAVALFLALPVAGTVARPRLGFATFPFMAIAFSLAMTCGLAIVHAVANGSRTVEDWPTIDLYAWLESCLIVGAALVCSVTPALFLATLFSSRALVTVGLMLFGAHLVFPYVVLSILDNQTVMAPISLDVLRGFKRSRQECRVFYVAAGATLAAPLVYFWFAPPEPLYAGIGAALCVVIAFLYAAMLGRFAYSLAINEEEEHALQREA